jgi:hypothetical protein
MIEPRHTVVKSKGVVGGREDNARATTTRSFVDVKGASQVGTQYRLELALVRLRERSYPSHFRHELDNSRARIGFFDTDKHAHKTRTLFR